MFYFESDKREVKGWIKNGDDTLRKEHEKIINEIRGLLGNFVNTQQLSQYDAEFRSQIDIFLNDKFSSINREFNSLKIDFASSAEVDALKRDLNILGENFPASSAEVDSLKKDVGNLKSEIISLKKAPAPTVETDVLKKDMVALKAELAVLKNIPKPSVEIDALKQELAALKAELAALKQSPAQTAEIAALKAELAAIKQSPAQTAEIAAIKSELATLKQSPAQTAEIAALKAELAALKQSPAQTAEITALKAELAAIKQSPAQTAEIAAIKAELAAIKQSPAQTAEIAALKAELAAIKQSPAQTAEIAALKAELAAIKQSPAQTAEIAALKAELAALKQSPAQTAEIAAIKAELAVLKNIPKPSTETDALKQEIFSLRQVNATILQELNKLKAFIANLIPPPPPPPEEPPEKIFFLPEQKDIFIPNERGKISEQIKQALNVSDIEKYLKANSSETSKKLQKLLDNHVKEVKKFADKLKLNDLDDDELSENVTAKYFKLFQRIIFDNILIAIKRAPKSSEKFYLGLLGKVNEYLTHCGIYTVNTTARRKAEAEDYENMKPQIIKTDDKNLSEKIKEIERLPYRINYLDEFGEQKALQYPGVMNIYKAV